MDVGWLRLLFLGVWTAVFVVGVPGPNLYPGDDDDDLEAAWDDAPIDEVGLFRLLLLLGGWTTSPGKAELGPTLNPEED